MTAVTSGAVTFTVSSDSALTTWYSQALPSAGNWSSMTVPSNAIPTICVGPTSGTILPFANKVSWSTAGNRIEIVAMDHNQSGGMHHYRYTESTNAVAAGPVEFGFAGTGIGHCYDQQAVNPYNGDLYHMRYATGGLLRLPYGSASWSSVSLPSGFSTSGITYGVDWVGVQYDSGGNTTTASGFCGTGVQGGLAVLNTSTNPHKIYIYDPVAASWLTAINGPSINSTYHTVFCYSPTKNVAIFGGTDSYLKSVYKLVTGGTVSALSDAPYNWGISCAQTVPDPVTGNFLSNTQYGFHAMDPDTGTWTLQTGTRAKPAAVNTNATNGNGNPAVALVSLPRHRCIGALSPNNGGPCYFHIYRHA